MRKGERENYHRVIRSLAPYLNIGWVFLISILIGLFGGRWLDKKFDTDPWLMLAGMILGIAYGFYYFLKVALRAK